MLTKEEHNKLIEVFEGSKQTRSARKQYNPEFPLNKVLLCGDCVSSDKGKFTGSRSNNGYKKKTTRYYFKYRCRNCNKAYHREEVHKLVTSYLGKIQYTGKQQREFVGALELVWKRKNQDKINDVKRVEKIIEHLEVTKSKLVLRLTDADSELEDDIKSEILRIKDQITEHTKKVEVMSNIEEDLIEFVKFALEYTNQLKQDWWDLDHESRVRCQQLLFPGGFYFDSAKKVSTPDISPIYGLARNKKDLSFSEKSLMVELAGTAPASASLLVKSILQV